MARKQLSKQQRLLIHGKFNGKCAYCGCDIAYTDMQVDHIEALNNGGVDEVENMNPACRSCNHYKSTLGIERFREELSLLPDRLSGKEHIIFGIAERYGLVQKTGAKVQFQFEKNQECET